MIYFLLIITLSGGWYFNQVQSDVPIKPLWNATWTDILKRNLLTTYDRYVRPGEESNGTSVSLQLTITNIDIVERKSLLVTDGWLMMKWNDDKLKWSPGDFGGLKTLHVSSHEIWIPDILLYNTANGGNINYYGQTNCIVYNNGLVLWVPPIKIEAFCNLNLYLWPFDKHMCRLKFGSWTYHAYVLDVKISEEEPIVLEHQLLDNNEWKITERIARRNSVIYPCCEEPYPNIEYNITVVRQSPIYKTISITPIVIIILLALANFWLPPQSGEKILLNGINAIIIVSHLYMFSQKFPSLSDRTPLIVIYFSASLYLITFSIILSVIVINLSRTKRIRAIPHSIKKLIYGSIGTILGIQRLNKGRRPNDDQQNHTVTGNDNNLKQINDDQIQLETENQSSSTTSSSSNTSPMGLNHHNSNTSDWILFATFIDRLFFIVYCIIFTLLFIICAI